MKKKMLSIIIPVYNAEKYIKNILLKLTNQKNEEIEIILIDDGSRDRSLDICKEFSVKDSDIIVFHQENQGASEARNQGIKLSNGEYIVFVDSDDDITDDFISTLCTLCKEKSTDIIQLDSYIVTSNNTDYKEVQLPEGKVEITSYCSFVLKQTVNALWDKIFKTEIIKSNQIYFDTNMVMGEDISFTLEVLKNAQSVYVNHVAIYKYGKNEDGLCSNVSDEYLRDLNILYEKMKKFIQAKNLNHDACETMHNSMLASVFRAVGLAINNGYSKLDIKKRISNSVNLQKLFKYDYKVFGFKLRKILLSKNCYLLISLLVKSKQK